MAFVVFTDTSANLPTKTLREYDLPIVPFSYIKDGEALHCMDLDAFDADDFYTRLRGNKTVSTSMINTTVFVEAWEPHLKDGFDILYVGMSSGISGSYSAACAAASMLRDEFPGRRIETFDTLAASLGEGFQALDAAKMRLAGKSLDEVLAYLEGARKKMHQVFTVDDLLYLSRGGRVSRTAALAGTVLNIKPILQGDAEGKIVVTSKARGRKNAVRRLADDYAEHADRGGLCGIAHGGCREDAEALRGLLKTTDPACEVLIVDYEPVTGSHVGPGALALFYYGDEKQVKV